MRKIGYNSLRKKIWNYLVWKNNNNLFKSREENEGFHIVATPAEKIKPNLPNSDTDRHNTNVFSSFLRSFFIFVSISLSSLSLSHCNVLYFITLLQQLCLRFVFLPLIPFLPLFFSLWIILFFRICMHFFFDFAFWVYFIFCYNGGNWLILVDFVWKYNVCNFTVSW